MSNKLSSFPAAPAIGPLHRHGGRITALGELPIHAGGDDYTLDGNGSVLSLPALAAGTTIFLSVTGTPTFVHSTRLICPNGVSYTAVGGDLAIARSKGDGIWQLYVPNLKFTQSGSGAVARTISSKIAEFFSVTDFGADPTGVADSTTAIQNAINAAAGGTVFFPIGQYKTTATITITGPVHFLGSGTGAGPGAVLNSNCTQIVPNFTGGDVIYAHTNYGCVFENFQITCSAGVRASGAGIHIAGSGGNNANSIIRNVAFSSQYIGISQTDCSSNIVTETYHQGWARSAFYNESTGPEVGPGAIYNNYFFGQTTSTATQQACIELHSGYAHIYDNLILGAQIGVYLIVDQHDSGNPHIHHNWIEEQAISGIYCGNNNGKNCSMLQIDHNEFSNVANVANYQSVITTVAGAAAWLESVQILGNVIRSSFTGTNYYINCQSGTNVLISNNVLMNLNSNANSYAFLTGAQIAAPFVISNNVMMNFGSARKYSFGTALPIIRDVTGLAFAELPSAANGSQAFVTDGTPGSPVAGAGTGSMAFRQNGAWKGF